MTPLLAIIGPARARSVLPGSLDGDQIPGRDVRRRGPGAESAFWAGVLGDEVHPDGDWHMVTVDGEPRVGVQYAPDHVAPDWPDGSPPQQIHLDLWVDDFASAHQEVMELGARVLREAQGNTVGDDFQVYADPAGHPFCLCWLVGDGPATEPTPHPVQGG